MSEGGTATNFCHSKRSSDLPNHGRGRRRVKRTIRRLQILSSRVQHSLTRLLNERKQLAQMDHVRPQVSLELSAPGEHHQSLECRSRKLEQGLDGSDMAVVLT